MKLGNVFLNQKIEVKIGDFGLSTKLEFDGDRKRFHSLLNCLTNKF